MATSTKKRKRQSPSNCPKTSSSYEAKNKLFEHLEIVLFQFPLPLLWIVVSYVDRHLFDIGTVNRQDRGSFDEGCEIAVDDRFIYVSDIGNHFIHIFTIKGTRHQKFGGMGEEIFQFHYPRGIAVNNSKLFVADTLNHRIQIFQKPTKEDNYLFDVEEELRKNKSTNIVADRPIYLRLCNEKIILLNYGMQVMIFNISTCVCEKQWSVSRLRPPQGLACGDGKIYLVDQNKFYTYSMDGVCLSQSKRRHSSYPSGLDYDYANGVIYITDEEDVDCFTVQNGIFTERLIKMEQDDWVQEDGEYGLTYHKDRLYVGLKSRACVSVFFV